MTDPVRALKDKATELMVKGKLPKALEAWQAVVAAAPQDVAAEQKVAELQAKLGHRGEAVALYERVARRYAEQGHFFKASAVCRLVLGLDPGHQRTQELIASLFAKQRGPAKPAAPVPATPAPAPGGLPSIPLFSTLAVEELKAVLGTAMEVRAYGPGELIVAEGAPGDSMFALVEGSAGIFRGFGTPAQRRVAELASGDIFGEVALLSGAPRVATVAADGDAVALEFPRAAMARVIEQHSNIGAQLEQFCQERLLSNALRASPVLRALPEAERAALSSAFVAATFVPGQRVISEGEAADAVFILVRGACEVTHSSGARYPELREGDLFGELSALTGEPPTATVKAKGTALTLKLPASEFKARVLAHPAAKAAVDALAKARLARTEQLDLEHGVDVRI
jgi:cAMP-dependent protein kinase regulator